MMKKAIAVFLIIFTLSVPALAFDDMAGSEWAEQAVNTLAQSNIISGVSENSFAPQENVTYEQLAKMVAEAFGMNGAVTEAFADVAADRWSAAYINGTGAFFAKKVNNQFTPEAYVPRFEVAGVITQAAFAAKGIQPQIESLSGFADVDVLSSQVMQNWIAEAKNNGIVNGYEDGTFRPQENVTRAETAVMLLRAMNIENKGEVEVTAIQKVAIQMEDGGKMVVELYPEYAPKTVENFLSLVKSGFYNGLTFHRVISGFMIQGGDPQGTGMGGSDKKIPGEFINNGFAKNTLKHTRGVISMARASDPNSASSQFFIMHQDAPYLDGNYAAFGKVVEGIEEVDKIAAVQKNASDKPITPVVIKSMEIVES